MSFAINAVAAADAGDLDDAYRSFIVAAGLDLDEELTGRGDTHAGLHGTALGGAWLAVVLGFAGVALTEEGLRIDPRLPAQWTRLRFNLAVVDTLIFIYINLAVKGTVVNVTIDHGEITLRTSGGQSLDVPLRVAGQKLTLARGQTLRITYGE